MTVEVVQTAPATVSVTQSDSTTVEAVVPVIAVEARTHITQPQAGGMWIETGLGPYGQDWTIWFEDGE